MEKISRLTAQQRDDLVAYLDGELDEPMTQQIEQMLAQSNVARHEVDMLARTWDLLSILPTPRASADFTRRTISSLEARPKSVPLSQQPWYRATRRTGVFAGWMIGLTLAGWLGFLITARWVPNDADLLVEELPVIQNFQKYAEVGDIEYLRELKRNRNLFHDGQAN